jgi:hypothetical protein
VINIIKTGNCILSLFVNVFVNSVDCSSVVQAGNINNDNGHIVDNGQQCIAVLNAVVLPICSTGGLPTVGFLATIAPNSDRLHSQQQSQQQQQQHQHQQQSALTRCGLSNIVEDVSVLRSRDTPSDGDSQRLSDVTNDEYSRQVASSSGGSGALVLEAILRSSTRLDANKGSDVASVVIKARSYVSMLPCSVKF